MYPNHTKRNILVAILYLLLLTLLVNFVLSVGTESTLSLVIEVI